MLKSFGEKEKLFELLSVGFDEGELLYQEHGNPLERGILAKEFLPLDGLVMEAVNDFAGKPIEVALTLTHSLVRRAGRVIAMLGRKDSEKETFVHFLGVGGLAAADFSKTLVMSSTSALNLLRSLDMEVASNVSAVRGIIQQRVGSVTELQENSLVALFGYLCGKICSTVYVVLVTVESAREVAEGNEG